MSKYVVKIKIEQTMEILADSHSIAIKRAKIMAAMKHPKSEVTSVTAYRAGNDKAT